MAGAKPTEQSRHMDRARYTAFAFTAADILLELDAAAVIRFAAGPTVDLIGREPDHLVGTPLFDLIAAEDKDYSRRLLDAVTDSDRADMMLIRIGDRRGRKIRFVMSARRVPEFGDRLFLALSRAKPNAAGDLARAAERDPESGLLVRDAFVAIAGEKLRTGSALGNPCRMTLLGFDGIDRLRGHYGDDGVGTVLAELGAALRARSIDGDSVGHLGADVYGVIHARDLGLDGVRRWLETQSRPLARGEPVTVRSVSFELNPGGLSEADAIRALAYTIDQFSAADGTLRLGSLVESHQAMLDATLGRMSDFRSAVSAGSFQVGFQPIVDLNSLEVHHHEALARFADHEAAGSADAMITFAEEIGMIAEFDLAMCRRVAMAMAAHGGGVGAPMVAVNLSARSLMSFHFMARLRAYLADLPAPVRQALMFELTETYDLADLDAANAVLQQLRAAGHLICLDDFGVGATNLDYLRQLEVDFVKIDGAYVQSAREGGRGAAFMKGLARLCADLGLRTVAEMVEDQTTADLLRAAGIGYGQGFLFGRPELELPRP